MQKSRILSDTKIRKIFKELNNFFYKQEGVNIAVENALNSDDYHDFYNEVKDDLNKQITEYLESNNFEEVYSNFSDSDSDKIIEEIVLISLANYLNNDTTSKYLKWAAITGGIVALDKMNSSSLEFSLGKKSQKIINDRIDYLIPTLDKTTTKWLGMMTKRGLSQGMVKEEIVEFVKINLDDYLLNRADIISETEFVNMFSEFVYLTYVNNGAKRMRWVTSHDEATCEICLANEAEGFIDINQEFSSGSLYPPAHMKCRCFTEPDRNVTGKVWRG